MNIPQYEDHSVSTDNINDPILRAKEKLKNHHSTQVIECHHENKSNTFCFSNITHTKIEKELNKFDFSKSSPNSYIPTKIVKDNIDIFKPILHQEFTKSLELGKFLSEIKLVDVLQLLKKRIEITKNYSPIGILPKFSIAFACLTNFLYFWIRYFQNTNVDSVKALMPSIV